MHDPPLWFRKSASVTLEKLAKAGGLSSHYSTEICFFDGNSNLSPTSSFWSRNAELTAEVGFKHIGIDAIKYVQPGGTMYSLDWESDG